MVWLNGISYHRKPVKARTDQNDYWAFDALVVGSEKEALAQARRDQFEDEEARLYLDLTSEP